MKKMAKQEPNPLPFYGVQNDFWAVKIILVKYQSFQSGPNHFGQVHIVKISPEKSNLNLTKVIWTVQNNFGPRERQGIEIGHF